MAHSLDIIINATMHLKSVPAIWTWTQEEGHEEKYHREGHKLAQETNFMLHFSPLMSLKIVTYRVAVLLHFSWPCTADDM